MRFASEGSDEVPETVSGVGDDDSMGTVARGARGRLENISSML